MLSDIYEELHDPRPVRRHVQGMFYCGPKRPLGNGQDGTGDVVRSNIDRNVWDDTTVAI